MYYLISECYVGPNGLAWPHIDADRILISTKAIIGNSSGDEIVDGWAGTTDDWAYYAYGKYPTIEAARAAMLAIFGTVRDTDVNGYSWPRDELIDAAVVEIYKPGEYERMTAEGVSEWAHDGLRADIFRDTSDSKIEELAADYERLLNVEGYTAGPISVLTQIMQRERQRLIDR